MNERIATARVVDVPDPAPGDVRFGARVTFRFNKGPQSGQNRTFTIVGADEASVKDGRIAFLAPLARALMGRQAGEKFTFEQGTTPQELEVLLVEYV